MLYACSRCGRFHARGQCPIPAPVYTRRKKDKTDTARFRSSTSWKKTSMMIRERDGCCRLCLSRGSLVTHGLEVHHIVPAEQNERLRLDSRNLITLCTKCHKLVEGDPRYAQTLKALAATPPTLRTPPRGSTGDHPDLSATTAPEFSMQYVPKT